MDNIQIYDSEGNEIGNAVRFRWAQFRELRSGTMRYENFITGRVWPRSIPTIPGPYVIHVNFIMPELNKPINQWFTGVVFNYNDIFEGGIAFKARVLSLDKPITLK